MKEQSSSTSSPCVSVMDGSDITKLVENQQVFTNFVNHKFQELDADGDGKLSVKELQPAVADIGAALGLPAQGNSPDSDHIYTQVLHEFTQGKRDKLVGKDKFKEVFSDILLGVADGLKRDPVTILGLEGHALHTFLRSSTFEPEVLSIYSQIEPSNRSLKDCMIRAFQKLSIDQGMPPSTDPWVKNNIIEYSLASLGVGDVLNQPTSQETFLVEFTRAVDRVALLLKEQPVFVAHSQNTFDGSGIKRLLSTKLELNKAMDSALKLVPRDKHGKVSKEYLGMALDSLAAFAGLPPLGAVDQMDGIMSEALKMVEKGDGKTVKEQELRSLLTQVLGSVMLQLDGNPISVSTNSVVHEPVPSSSSTLLQP